MDRMEEYEALRTLPAPPALDGAVERARKRARRRRLRRLWAAPAGSVAAVFAAFVLLVNLSTPFALACSGVPFLRQLTAAVALSPSLKAAVENEYVQYIGQSQTDHGVTMTVEHIIVDQKQVNVFFTVQSGPYGALEGSGDLSLPDGGRAGCGISFPQPPEDPDGLWRLQADFTDNDVPDTLVLDYSFWPVASEDAPAPLDSGWWDDVPEEPEAAASFRFTLHFDPRYTAEGERVALDVPFTLDGQALRITALERYPTHVRVEIEEDAANSAQLQSLDCWLEDAGGNRYGRPDGLTAHGSAQDRVTSYHFESDYFSKAGDLTLHIGGAVWRNKDQPWVTVDLAAGQAEGLPEGVRFLGAERTGADWTLSFRAPMRDSGALFYQLFSGLCRAPDGSEYHIDQFSNTFARAEDGSDLEGYFDLAFPLRDYPWDTVEAEPFYSHATQCDPDLALPLT